MTQVNEDRKPTLDTNILIVTGNLTRPVEERGKTATFGVAVHTIEKVEGEPYEVPFFPEVTTFGKTAENCLEYLDTGRKVLIEGTLRFDEYEVKNDKGEVLFYDEECKRPVMRQVPRILARRVEFL